MDKKLLKSILIIISYCVLLVAVIINIQWIASAVTGILALLSPVFIGFGVAFVLNRPYTACLSLYSKIKRKKNKDSKKKYKDEQTALKAAQKHEKRMKNLRKALALLTVYILFLAFIVLLVSLVSPEIGNSISQLSSNIDLYVENLNDILTKIDELLPFELTVANPELTAENVSAPQTVSLTEFIGSKLTEFTHEIPTLISSVLPDIFSFTKTLASSLMNWLLGFVMSVYMLASKETLISQLKRFYYAFVPKKAADKTCEILSISSNIFSNFVNGRIYDALIIGMICFICMSIFGFQYTLLISVVVAVTNVIPIFGPFIGAIPSIFLLLLVDPMQAVWFTIFIIVLQQFDGNLIGPKVVGDSIGLPAWWVMFSILIGGGLMGVLGMLLGVPTFAVIYKLLTVDIDKRLKKKELSVTDGGKK